MGGEAGTVNYEQNKQDPIKVLHPSQPPTKKEKGKKGGYRNLQGKRRQQKRSDVHKNRGRMKKGKSWGPLRALPKKR